MEQAGGGPLNGNAESSLAPLLNDANGGVGARVPGMGMNKSEKK